MTKTKISEPKRTQIYILVEKFDPPSVLHLRGDFALFKEFVTALQQPDDCCQLSENAQPAPTKA
jgi:hypothetical protein